MTHLAMLSSKHRHLHTIGPETNLNDFGFFLELIGRFEFDFRRCGHFWKDSKFWCVQSSITCNEAVHVHVLWACLCPHNSISNVVVSVTIHDDKYK